MIAAEIENEYGGYPSEDRLDFGPPGLFDDPGAAGADDIDDLAALIAIQRVDSRDVVFDKRQKKAKILGHYVMGDLLGEGSYAKVKEAVDQTTLCRRAVKIMKRRKLRRIPHGEENVQREVKLLSSLNHKNVMKLIEVFYNDEKGKIYLVLEYCCAVLKDMLDESDLKKFPLWQAHFYFGQLLEGLEYLHSHRIVHKDIKPGNLLLDTSGVLKIADFGTSEVLDRFAPDDTCTNSQGTPAFQPPEIARGAEMFPGFKIDIWSSGITLYNFVTGTYPFSGDTIFRLFEDIAKCDVKVPSDIDPVLTNLLLGMLRDDPYKRFSLLDVKGHDWMRKKQPVNAPPVTVKPRNDDPALSTTVIPYLCHLHYGSQVLNEEGGEGLVPEGSQTDFTVTEHQLKEQRRQDAETGNGCSGGRTKASEASRGEATRTNQCEEKTTRCLKVRKLTECVIS